MSEPTRVVIADHDTDERMETGPLRFGTDWAGLFVRGDDAASYALALEHTLGILEDADADIDFCDTMQIEHARRLVDLLTSCQEPCHARTVSTPSNVSLNDGDEQRNEKRWLIQDRGRTRELRLRVARGVIKDIKPRSRHKRDCPLSVSYEVGSGALYECTCGVKPRDGRDVL